MEETESAAGWVCDGSWFDLTLFKLCKLLTNHLRPTSLLTHSFHLAEGADSKGDTWHISYDELVSTLLAGALPNENWQAAVVVATESSDMQLVAFSLSLSPSLLSPILFQCSLISPTGSEGCWVCFCRNRVRRRWIINRPLLEVNVIYSYREATAVRRLETNYIIILEANCCKIPLKIYACDLCRWRRETRSIFTTENS